MGPDTRMEYTMTWHTSTRPGIVEALVDAQGKATGHVISRNETSGIYTGKYNGAPVGSASMSIYPVRKALEQHARDGK